MSKIPVRRSAATSVLTGSRQSGALTGSARTPFSRVTTRLRSGARRPDSGSLSVVLTMTSRRYLVFSTKARVVPDAAVGLSTCGKTPLYSSAYVQYARRRYQWKHFFTASPLNSQIDSGTNPGNCQFRRPGNRLPILRGQLSQCRRSKRAIHLFFKESLL